MKDINQTARRAQRWSCATLTLCGAFSQASIAATPSCGNASWYGDRFSGRATASGEPFDPHSLTAAHRTLPFGTRVAVNDGSMRRVTVTINDRGPYVPGRIIDLSAAAAAKLRMKNAGVLPVCLDVVPDPAMLGDDALAHGEQEVLRRECHEPYC